MKSIAFCKPKRSTLSLLGAAGLFSVALLAGMPAEAQTQNWGQAFETAGDTVGNFQRLVAMLAYAAGTILACLGFWLMYKDGKEEGRGHMKNGIMALVIGGMLLIFPTTVGWTVGTMGGDSQVDEQQFERF